VRPLQWRQANVSSIGISFMGVTVESMGPGPVFSARTGDSIGYARKSAPKHVTARADC
jgi:hypothetical protein